MVYFGGTVRLSYEMTDIIIYNMENAKKQRKENRNRTAAAA